MDIEKALTYLFLVVLLVLLVNYNYYIFAPIVLGIYFIAQRTWLNLLLVFLYAITLFMMGVEFGFILLSAVVLLALVIIVMFLFKKKESSSSEDLDFSSLFGGGTGQ